MFATLGALGLIIAIGGPILGFVTWVLLIRFLWNAGAPRRSAE